MGYAVVGYFDQNSDERIKSLWQGMADIQVCDYLIRSDNNPHIKFAMFDELDVGLASCGLERIARETKAVGMHFKTYSFYSGEEPFLCIDTAVSAPLLALQETIQTICNAYGTGDGRGFFRQGIWKPDCQLTRGFHLTKLADAVHYLSQTQLPFDGKLERIGLIEFHPAKQVFAHPLA